MVISSFTIFAWVVKPAIGYVIDNFLDKKIWIFISVVLDIVTVVFLGVMFLPIVILVGLMVFNSANSAFRDVAVDGIMCVEGKKDKTTGKIQSIQWISISVAAMVVGIGGGYIAEKFGYRQAFLCLVPIYLAVGLTTHFYREEKTTYVKRSSTFVNDMKKIFADKRILIVGLFIFLYKFSPSFGTPLFFIQRDVFHWGKIWIGTLTTIGTLFGIAGSILYYRYSQKINLKKWLFFSVFLGAVTSLSYLYYTPVTAVAYDIIYSLIGMFIFLMVMDFMARKTVAGLEATSFALLTSVSNLALVASNLSGAYLLPKVGLNGLIIASALASFLCLPLISKID